MRQRTGQPLLLAAVVGLLAHFGGGLVGSIGSQPSRDGFPHERHASVFPTCTSCHGDVFAQVAPEMPSPAQCASCHDGEVERRVQWAPRTVAVPTNRRFTHPDHLRAALAKAPSDSVAVSSCASCHVPAGDGRMSVRRNVLPQCLSCHGVTAPHVEAPPETCATCHLRLTDARSLSTKDISDFSKPSSHAAPDFALGGHGRLARTGVSMGAAAVAADCATCHSRDLCLSCHVNAPESPVIQALGLDARAPVRMGGVPVPATHGTAAWLRAHGRDAQRQRATCTTCHARESCLACHQGTPPPTVTAVVARGPGRAVGANPVRTRPTSHDWEFSQRHAAEASARPRSCESCHARETCLTCHRPENAGAGAYHPRDFISRHPSAAYSRQAGCADCHNTAQFCQSCHQSAGLVATGRLGTKGYHDAFRGFSLGHGQAARQSLESCVGCHVERDCTACHSAVGGGFRFSPHGPGFDAERLRRKNPTFCIACHGRSIPRR